MGMVENLEKMLENGRDDSMLRFGLGSAYFRQENFSAAVVNLKACLERDSTYSAAYKLLGKAYLKQDNKAEAVKIFEKGIQIADRQGDKQSRKEMQVFLRKVQKI